MKPKVLIDKSFLHSLNVDEALWFDHFFTSVLTPVLYQEIIADLHKDFDDGRDAKAMVDSLIRKLPKMNFIFPDIHIKLAVCDLLGLPFDENGKVNMGDFSQNMKIDIMPGISKEYSRFDLDYIRLITNNLSPDDIRLAKLLRDKVDNLDINRVIDGLNKAGLVHKTCSSLDTVKNMVDFFCRLQSDKITDHFIFSILGVPKEFYDYIETRWNLFPEKELNKFSPYALSVAKIKIFFSLAISASLIPKEANSFLDLELFSYLRFSNMMVSKDKRTHSKLFPYFSDTDQEFVYGPDLQEDLSNISRHFQSFPEDIRRTGIVNFARTPPEGTLVAKLWDKYYPNWREVNQAKPFTTKEQYIALSKQPIYRYTATPANANTDTAASIIVANSNIDENFISQMRGSWYIYPQE